MIPQVKGCLHGRGIILENQKPQTDWSAHGYKRQEPRAVREEPLPLLPEGDVFHEQIVVAKPVRQLVEVFKRLVGKAEGDIGRYGDLKISCGQNIWLPSNEAERIKIELDQYYANVKSRKATMADIGNSHLGDAEQIMKEMEEEKALDAKYSTKTQVNDPNVPDVTNQAKKQPKNK